MQLTLEWVTVDDCKTKSTMPDPHLPANTAESKRCGKKKPVSQNDVFELS